MAQDALTVGTRYHIEVPGFEVMYSSNNILSICNGAAVSSGA